MASILERLSSTLPQIPISRLERDRYRSHGMAKQAQTNSHEFTWATHVETLQSVTTFLTP